MDNKTTQTIDPEVQIEQAISKSEKFIEKNGKNLLIALCVLVLAIGAYFGYEHLIKMPKENRASEAIFGAQNLFSAGEYEKALTGDGMTAGFLEVAKDFSSTPAGNIANHYAGVCQMKLGEYDAAIVSLGKYKKVNNSTAGIINAQNKGLIGDAYAQNNNLAKALTYYKEAVDVSDNDITAPYYLVKLGGVYYANGDKAKALECYETVKNKYFNSIESRNIDKLIGQIK